VSFPRLETGARRALSLVVWGDHNGLTAKPDQVCAESAFSRPAMPPRLGGEGGVSGPPRLVSGAPAYPGAELWARPLALRAAASPQRNV
jgi:hypothetical protein